jgi:serine/threonine protein phosphatase 1
MSSLKGRLLAVGDIHGHLRHLEHLMELVSPTVDDKVVFIGDYIDRGPDSKGVIDYLIIFGNRFPNTIYLRGNHEQMFLDAVTSYCRVTDLDGPNYTRLRDISKRAKYELVGYDEYDDWKIFMGNGGRSTLKSYGAIEDNEVDFEKIPKEHFDFINATRLFHEETVEVVTEVGIEKKEFLFVHAGIAPGVPLEKQDRYDLLWIRDRFIDSASKYEGRIVVHGHTPENLPAKSHCRICVDSGVYMAGSNYADPGTGKLSCCNVLTGDIWQV